MDVTDCIHASVRARTPQDIEKAMELKGDNPEFLFTAVSETDLMDKHRLTTFVHHDIMSIHPFFCIGRFWQAWGSLSLLMDRLYRVRFLIQYSE